MLPLAVATVAAATVAVATAAVAAAALAFAATAVAALVSDPTHQPDVRQVEADGAVQPDGPT